MLHCECRPGAAIEWLIRRYRIHERNVDAIMSCILPFHDTPFFARMLQITRVDHATAPVWSFLKTAQVISV